MRLLRLPYTVVRIPVELAAEIARRLLSREDDRPLAVRVPESPRYFRSPEPARSRESGAEVNVQEPWPGYGDMTAAEIIAQLRGATTEAAAAVSLFEAANKGRSSVLKAAARGMRG